jgi:hypothetical protein
MSFQYSKGRSSKGDAGNTSQQIVTSREEQPGTDAQTTEEAAESELFESNDLPIRSSQSIKK